MKIKPIQEHARYATLATEINELGIALGKVQAQLLSVEASIAAASGNLPERGEEDALVEAALAFAAGGPVVRPAQIIQSLNEERQVLKDQEGALIKTIRTRNQVRDQVAEQLSIELGGTLGETHRALASQYLQTLYELEKIHVAEADLINAIEAAGYTPRFPESIRHPMQIGTLDDSSSPLTYRVKELRRYVG